MTPLTEGDRELLAFEKTWWHYPGAKETEIRRHFGMSATRYYQALNALIDNPAAELAEPMLIKRLRRLREARKLRTALNHSGSHLTN